MSIKFLAELTLRTGYPPERALATNTYDRQYHIYVLALSRPTGSNYWTNWGGTYDNPEVVDAEIFFSQFLTQVTSSGALTSTVNSFFIDGFFMFIHLERKPWQYFTEETEFSRLDRYSSCVRDESKPSDWYFTSPQSVEIKVPVRLMIPNVNMKLSDPISGSVKLSNFTLNFINDDGFFDDIDDTNYLNTPVTLKRTSVDIPDLDDFNVIREGIVDYVRNSQSTFSVIAAERFRSFTEPVNRNFNTTDFPSLPSSNVDKPIPIGYGPLEDVPLTNVGTNQWVGIDPDYLVSVTTVYDSSGSSISFTVSNGIITATGASTCDCNGKANNNIGEIITSEIASKSDIPYISDNWDTTETNDFITDSYDIGFYFIGNVRDLIKEALKSDMGWLITKNNGKLSLRRYGTDYNTYTLENWKIMSFPTNNTEDSKRLYNSSALIEYGYQVNSGNYNLNKLYNADESSLFELYRKKARGYYQTNLLNSTDAADLGQRLVERFGTVSEILTIPVAEDTTNINLWDKITLDVTINDRQFSTKTTWFVREVNPGQDLLVLESASA